jgi:hypothetical protein
MSLIPAAAHSKVRGHATDPVKIYRAVRTPDVVGMLIPYYHYWSWSCAKCGESGHYEEWLEGKRNLLRHLQGHTRFEDFEDVPLSAISKFQP